jgi:hypothetical protein
MNKKLIGREIGRTLLVMFKVKLWIKLKDKPWEELWWPLEMELRYKILDGVKREIKRKLNE